MGTGLSHRLPAYGLVLAVNLLALMLTILFAPVVPTAPFPLLAAAVGVAGWYGGISAGLLSALFATLATDYFFFTPQNAIVFAGDDLPRLALFLLVAGFASASLAKRKRLDAAKEKLRTVEESFSKIFHSSPLAVATWRLSDGLFLDANESFLGMLGYQREEIVAHTGMELNLYADPESQANAVQALCEYGSLRDIEIQYRTKEGDVRETLSGLELIEQQGDLCVLTLSRDITERKRVREELVKLSSAIEQTADSVIITNREGVIEYVNPAFEQITGFTSREAIGRTPRLLKSGEHPESFYEELWKTILAGGAFRAEFVNRKKSGEHYSEEKTITPIRDEQGTITHFVSTGKDITDRAQAFQALERRVAERTRETEQLYAQAEERRRELEALYRADEHLYRHLRLDQVLQALVDVVIDLLNADKASVQVWDLQRERLVVRAARNYSEEMIALMSSYIPGDGIAGKVFQTGEPIAVEDARFAPPPADRIAAQEGIRSVLSVPITIGDQIFGVFGMDYCQPRAFSAGDKRLFLALAQRAARAIENARLYEQAEQAATMEERQRLARELHDSVTQSLYSLMLLSEAGRRYAGRGDLGQVGHHLNRLGETAQQALKEMRLLVYELRPMALQKVGLAGALQQRLDAVERRAGIQAGLKVSGTLDLPAQLEEGLYRIAQEALNNALKHAGSTATTVSISQDGEAVQLEIADNGKGFDATAIDGQGGIGLSSMRERAEGLGACLVVDSVLGRGTTVSITVRIPQEVRV